MPDLDDLGARGRVPQSVAEGILSCVPESVPVRGCLVLVGAGTVRNLELVFKGLSGRIGDIRQDFVPHCRDLSGHEIVNAPYLDLRKRIDGHGLDAVY